MKRTNSPSLTAFDLLTVDEFADRLKVSRTTVFSLLKKGSLQEGLHYIRLGRILRFRWQDDLFFSNQAMPLKVDNVGLSPLPVTEAAEDSQPGAARVNNRPLTFQPGAARVNNRPLASKRSKEPAINLEY